MLGIIYLILAEILGYKASKILIEEETKFSFINRIWLILPASFGVGTLLLTWVVYIISWFFSVVGKVENPLLYGNAIGMAGDITVSVQRIVFIVGLRRHIERGRAAHKNRVFGEKLFDLAVKRPPLFPVGIEGKLIALLGFGTKQRKGYAAR